MRKIFIICSILLLFQGICFAKIEHGSDSFDGTSCYYVDHSPSILSMDYLNSSFIVFYKNNTYDGKGFEITISKDDGYSIDDTIKMQIDDTIYTWKTNADSIRSASVYRSFPIPDNVYNKLMNTKQNIAVRFYYSSLSGDYEMDFVIPYKKVQEAQKMFETYIPKNIFQEQSAK